MWRQNSSHSKTLASDGLEWSLSRTGFSTPPARLPGATGGVHRVGWVHWPSVRVVTKISNPGHETVVHLKQQNVSPGPTSSEWICLTCYDKIEFLVAESS